MTNFLLLLVSIFCLRFVIFDLVLYLLFLILTYLCFLESRLRSLGQSSVWAEAVFVFHSWMLRT